MENPNPIHYSDLVSPDNSITDLIAQLSALSDKYEEMKGQIQSSATEMSRSMQGVSGATAEQRTVISQTAKEAESLATSMMNVRAAQIKNNEALSRLNGASREYNRLQKLEAELARSQEGSYNRLSAQYSINKIRLNEMSSAERSGTDAGRKLEAETRKLYEEMSRLQKATGKYTLEVGHYENALKGLPGPIGSVISSLSSMRTQMSAIRASDMPGIQKGISGTATMIGGIIGAVSLFSRAFGSARTVVRDFEQANANLATVLGVSNDEMVSMANAARQLAADTQYSATQVSELQMALAKLGFSQDEIKGMQTAVAQFATAVGTDLTTAAEIAGSTLNSFGLDAKDAEDVLGVLAVATNKTSLTIDGFRSALNKVFPTAKSYGFSLEDTTALLGTLANTGMDATTAASTLNRIFLNLADSNGKLSSALGGSVNSFDALIDGMIKLRSEGVDLNGALELTDKRSAAAFGSFLDGAEKARDLRDALSDVSGKLEEIADQRLATTQGAIEQLNSAWENLLLSFDNGNNILGSLTSAATAFIQAITPKTELEKAGKQVEKVFKKMNGDVDAAAVEIGRQIDGLRFQLIALSEYQPTKAEGFFGKMFRDNTAEYNAIVQQTTNQMTALVDAANAAFRNRVGQYNWTFSTAGAFQGGVGPLAPGQEPTTTTTTTTKPPIVIYGGGGGKKAAPAWSVESDPAYNKQRLALLKQYQAGELATKEDYERAVAQLEIETINKRIGQLKAGNSERLKLEQDVISKTMALREKQKKQEEADAKKAEEDAKKENKARLDNLNKEQQAIQLQIAITEKGTEEMLALRIELINKQRDIELEQNRQKTEELRQDEAAINAKYDAMALAEQTKFTLEMSKRDLAARQEWLEAEMDMMVANDRERNMFRLGLERQRLEESLRMNKDAINKMTDEEVEAVKHQIEAIQHEMKTMGYSNMWEVMGVSINADQQEALQTAIGSVKESLDSILDSWGAIADAAVESANKQVDAAQKVLDMERKAAAEGYANNQKRAEKELALAKKQQAAALKEQEKATKARLALDTLTQVSSLVTASANIWQAFSGYGVPGIALAVAAIALMFGSFAVAKIKAAQAAKTETYGEGTVEMLQGGSHASGHDISLGRKSDGTERRAEGGEFFAVINKRNSRRYRSVIPDVINSLNDGTFGEKYINANSRMAVIAGNTDLSRIETGVDAIRKQGEKSRTVEGDYVVLRYRNLTRRIRS